MVALFVWRRFRERLRPLQEPEFTGGSDSVPGALDGPVLSLSHIAVHLLAPGPIPGLSRCLWADSVREPP